MNNDKLFDLISESLGVEKDKIIPESDFYNDFNADKFEVADLIVKVQQMYHFEINEADYPEIQKVGDLLRIIEENSDEI